MDAVALLRRDAPGPDTGGREPLRERIAQRLAALIGSGALAVGDPLPSERELAAAMGVSRETIRTALAMLASRGIVAVAQGARTTVASDDVGELGIPKVLPGVADGGYGLDDIHEGRLLVEGRIARLAAGRVGAEEMGRLERLVATQAGAEGDPVRYLVLDREFHALIYHAGGNRVLSDLALTLYAYLLDHRRRAVSRPGAIARSVDDHRAILDCLRRGDADGLADAFAVHERRIYETTRQALAATADDGSNGGDEP